MEMIKTTQYLKIEFKKVIETFNQIQANMRIELKTSTFQLENSREKSYK